MIYAPLTLWQTTSNGYQKPEGKFISGNNVQMVSMNKDNSPHSWYGYLSKVGSAIMA